VPAPVQDLNEIERRLGIARQVQRLPECGCGFGKLTQLPIFRAQRHQSRPVSGMILDVTREPDDFGFPDRPAFGFGARHAPRAGRARHAHRRADRDTRLPEISEHVGLTDPLHHDLPADGYQVGS
jgi:hypothetical protein